MAKEVSIKIKVDGQDVTLAGKQLDSLTNTIEDLKMELAAMGERTEENAELFDELTGDIDALEKSFEGATKEAKDYNKELDKTGTNVKNVGEEAGKSKKGFSAMSGGIRGIGTALKAAGIGLVLAIIGSLFSLLKKNQKVIDFFNTATKTMEILFSRLLDALSPLRDALVGAFNDPKQAVIDLWEIIKTNIMNRIMGIVDTFKFLGKTIQSAFELDWDGIKENAAAVGESMLQTLTGVDDLVGKVTDGFAGLVGEVKEATTAAKDYTDAINALALAEAEQNKTTAANQLTLELLKTTREDETKSIEERIAAADEIARLIQEETDGQIALQEEKLRLMKLDKEQTQTTIEDLVEIANAEAELDRIRAAAAVTNLENLKFANTLRKQEADRTQTEKDIEEARLKEFRDRRKKLENQWRLEDAETDQMFYDELRAQEIERNKLEMENKLLTYEEREFAEKEHKRRMDEIDENQKQTQMEREKVFADAQEEIDKNLVKSKEDTASAVGNILGKSANLFKKNTIAYKVLASAEAAINTYLSATKVYAGVASIISPAAPVLAAIAAGVTVASGLATVAKINNIKLEKGGILQGPSHAEGGIATPFGELEGGEAVINKTSTAMFAPFLSVINQAGGGKTFAAPQTPQSIGSGNAAPDVPTISGVPIMKTYVVSGEMTSEQEKEARLKDLSTI